METMKAYAMGQANRGNELMVFDWDKAARLIRESGCETAFAGLCSDWGNTGGRIFSNGEPDMDDYTFLASIWATPEIEIDGERIDCYKMQSEVPDWDSDTKWPDSAIKILKGV